MKVFKINPVNINLYSKNNVSNAIKNSKTQNLPFKNSNLQELMGRSQVSFKSFRRGDGLVYEYSEKMDAMVGRNPRTGEVVVVESQNPDCWYRFEYYEGRQNATKRKQYYNKSDDMFYDESYDRLGRIIFERRTKQDNSFKADIEYDIDGKEISHIEKYFNKDGSIRAHIILFPNTNKVQIRRAYSKKIMNEDSYELNPHRRISTRVFDLTADNRLLEECSYYPDGKIPKVRTTYWDNGSRVVEQHDEFGYRIDRKRYLSNGFLERYEEFYQHSNLLKEITRFKQSDGSKSIKRYDINGRYPLHCNIYDNEGNLKRTINYYKNSENISATYDYHGTLCIVREYSRLGRLMREYSKIIETVSAPPKQQQQRQRTLPISSDEAILNVLAKLQDPALDLSDIKEEEWKPVIKKLGLRSFKELLAIDKHGYLALAQTWHPDKCQGENESIYDALFKIISYFYKLNSNAASC